MLLTLLFSLMGLALPVAIAEDLTITSPDGGYTLTYSVSGSSASISAVESNGQAGSSLIFPSEIDGATVKTIGKKACKDVSSIQSVSWPSSVETIGDYALAGTSLSSLSLPSSACVIGKGAFSNCPLSGGVTLPENISIGKGAFYNSGISSYYLRTYDGSLVAVSVEDTCPQAIEQP